MKKFLSILLAISMLVSLMCNTTIASANGELSPDEVFATYVAELETIDPAKINELPKVQIDTLFMQAFQISGAEYTFSEKATALETLANFEQRFDTTPGSPGTIESRSNIDMGMYTGPIGVYWERDFKLSPITLSESLAGTYIFEGTYMSYGNAVATYVAATDYNILQKILDAGVSTVATEIVAAAMKIPNAKIPVACIGIVIGLGWTALKDIDTWAMGQALKAMSDNNMMRVVSYISNTSGVVNSYSKYVPYGGTVRQQPDKDGKETYSYSGISNPSSYGYHGIWHWGEVGNALK